MDIKAFFDKLNNKGIALPLLRDNDKKKGSITYTFFVTAGVLVVLSFAFDLGLYLYSHLEPSVNQINYYPKSELLMWFGTAGGLYFGRKTFPSKETPNETSN